MTAFSRIRFQDTNLLHNRIYSNTLTSGVEGASAIHSRRFKHVFEPGQRLRKSLPFVPTSG